MAVRPQLATDRGPALSSGNGLDPARHCRPWSIERQRPGWAWGLLLLPRAAQKPHISQREAFYAPIFSSQEISHLHHAGRLVKPINFTILYSQGLVKDAGVVARRRVGVCIQNTNPGQGQCGWKRRLWLLAIWTEDIRAPTPSQH